MTLLKPYATCPMNNMEIGVIETMKAVLVINEQISLLPEYRKLMRKCHWMR